MTVNINEMLEQTRKLKAEQKENAKKIREEKRMLSQTFKEGIDADTLASMVENAEEKLTAYKENLADLKAKFKADLSIIKIDKEQAKEILELVNAVTNSTNGMTSKKEKNGVLIENGVVIITRENHETVSHDIADKNLRKELKQKLLDANYNGDGDRIIDNILHKVKNYVEAEREVT